MNKQELLKRIGSIDSYCRADEFTFDSGKARGSRGIRVKCGDLAFTVLPDRAMDIAYAEFRGTPISFDSCVGVVSPAHYDEKDFLRSFTAGLLTTCGLSYMGGNCVDEGVELGLHGRIGNAPALDVGINRGWDGEDYILSISGRIKEATAFGENLELCRTISVKLFENTISIHDTVINNGFDTQPLMLLYHMNFGYPLVDAGTKLETNTQGPAPQTEVAAKGIATAKEITAPEHGYAEQVFHYKSVENSYAQLTNSDGLYARVNYENKNLPYFVEWKLLGEGTYVVGMEPGTNPPLGRANERKEGRLQFIKPGETKDFTLTIEIGKN